MKQPLELVWSLIFMGSPDDQKKYFARINHDWVVGTEDARLYDVINELIKEQKKIDLLTVVTKYREKGMLDRGVTVRMSKLSSRLYDLDAVLHLESIFDEVHRDYLYRTAQNTRNSLSNLLESDQFNEEKYRKIIKTADKPPAKQSEALSIDQLVVKIFDAHERAKNGDIGGIEIGYKCLKQVVLLEPVDLMIVGARPAMGKSAFAVNTMIRMAKEGKKVVLFALEMSVEQMMRRVLANICEIDSNKIKYGTCSDAELYKMFHAKELPYLQNITIYDGSQTVNSIAGIVNDHKSGKGIDCLIIDYLQKITPRNTKNRYEMVSEVSNGIKTLAQTLRVPVIALAQLSRDSSKLAKRPSLPDIRESGEIEQDASIVAFLHRPEYYGETSTYNGDSAENVCEFIVAKNREGELGIYDMAVNLKFSKFEG